MPLDWALKPSGLSDGDVFRLLFMSSTQRTASSTDIADYNTHVQTAAKAGHAAISDACGDLFKAVASTSAVDARANTDTESTDTAASVWWLGGAKAADDYADFYDGGWDSYARRNESGASRSIDFVWTGSNADGTKHASDYLGTAASARYGQPESGNNPINQNRNPAATNNYPLYGLSPLFKVEQRPTVSFGSSALSSGEQSSPALAVLLSEANSSGADLVIPLRVKSAGTTLSSSEYSLSGNDCDDAGGGSSTVTIGDGGQSDIPLIWLCGDDVDEPDETVIVELGALPDGWIAGATSEVAVTVTDDDATVVSVSASDSVLTEQDAADTASFEVSLGRRLLAGENLHVPLEWDYDADHVVALPGGTDPMFSVAVSGTGVAGLSLDSDFFRVRFTGHDTDVVRTATVTVTPTSSGDDDADDGVVVASLAFLASADWANAFTTVSGGGAPHADDNEVSFTFVDDDRVAGAGIVLDHGVLGAVAGGTVSSRVSLAVEPFGPVTVALSQSQINAGVASVSVSSLAFDRSNWDVPQVVRVDAHAQGSSLVSYTASGGGYDGVSVDQSVIVAAVPAAPSGCWKCVWASAGNSAGQPAPSGYRVGPTPEGEAVWFTVHVDQAASVDVEARLWVSDAKGWAAFFLPGRYAARTLGVWIPAGRTSATFSVPTVDDSRHEPGGSVSARIINAQNCSASRCSPYVGYYGAGPEPSVQVADNDPAPPPRVYPHRASLSLSTVVDPRGRRGSVGAGRRRGVGAFHPPGRGGAVLHGVLRGRRPPQPKHSPNRAGRQPHRLRLPGVPRRNRQPRQHLQSAEKLALPRRHPQTRPDTGHTHAHPRPRRPPRGHRRANPRHAPNRMGHGPTRIPGQPLHNRPRHPQRRNRHTRHRRQRRTPRPAHTPHRRPRPQSQTSKRSPPKPSTAQPTSTAGTAPCSRSGSTTAPG